MENSKLLNLLKKLSKQEFLSLGFYLKTPSFNKNKDLISLYEALCPFAPSFISTKIDSKEIFSKVHPEKKFSNIKLNHLCSLLTICTQNFLASIELRKEEYTKERLLLKRYDNKKFTDDFKAETINFKNHLEQKKPLDLAGHYHDFWLERTSYYHTGNIKKESKKNQVKLEKTFRNLNDFYILARLELICEMANRQKINIDKYDEKYFDLDFLPKEKQSTKEIEDVSNLIQLYTMIFRILRSEDTENGLSIAPKINNFINNIRINQEEKSIISVFLIHFVTTSMAKYPRKARIAYYKIMTSKLNAGEFIKGGYINPILIINLAFIGLGLNKIDLTQEIKRKYSDKIIKEKKTSTINLINAAIAHGEKRYSECIDHLSTINDNQFYIKNNVDLLYIRTYYELIKQKNKSAEKLFYIFSKRYIKYLHQSKTITPQTKNSNLTLLSFIKELVDHQKNKSKRSLIDFKNEIKESNAPLKLWLNDKIEEIVSIRETTSSK